MSNAVTSTGILVKRGAIVPIAAKTISTNSLANPTVVTTSTAHGLSSTDEVTITGSNSTPSINGTHRVTVLSPTTFSIPVNVTIAGSAGSVQPIFTTIAEITGVTPGGKSRNKIETSTHNEQTESHLLGILRQSDPALKINYIGSGDASHDQLQYDIDNNIKANWKFLFPSGVARTGQGYVQQFMYDEAAVDSKQGANIIITWAGRVTESVEAPRAIDA